MESVVLVMCLVCVFLPIAASKAPRAGAISAVLHAEHANMKAH